MPPHEHDDNAVSPFRPSRLAPHEHDDDTVSPFRPSHVHEPCPYVCASRRSRPRPYVHIRGRIFFLAPWLLCVRVNATCAPLLRHVRASTSTSMYVHIRDQNDNAMYASTRWVPTVRHFLACEDVADGSQQSGGKSIFFARNMDALPCVRRCSWKCVRAKKKTIRPPDCWDPPATSSHARKCVRAKKRFAP